jgi:hypothetical protein
MLSFERNLALLPTRYKTREGRELEIRLMEDQHLYLAWRWWSGHRGDSDTAEFIYEALQREKERRRYLREREKAELAEQGFTGKRLRRSKT